MKYEDALNTAIDLSLDPQGLHAFLAKLPVDVRQRLRDDLEVAAIARAEFSTFPKPIPSGERARKRLPSTVAFRLRQARTAGGDPGP